MLLEIGEISRAVSNLSFSDMIQLKKWYVRISEIQLKCNLYKFSEAANDLSTTYLNELCIQQSEIVASLCITKAKEYSKFAL